MNTKGNEKVYQIITEKIIKKLEEGTVPWNKPWVGGEPPQNLVSRKPYRGINTFLLNCLDYEAPYWLTFRQAKAKGGSIRKGEKGSTVIYWNWIEKEVRDEKGEIEKQNIPFLRYYTVFNVMQCDGVKYPEITKPEHTFNPIPNCEEVIKSFPNKPRLTHSGHQAFYRPISDLVNMPDPTRFDSAEKYYSVLFHELTHSTGHKSRLSRSTLVDFRPFGSSNYSKEELVAEMGAAFLCGHAGIENKTVDNSAAYIQGWLKKLRNDNKFVVLAAATAQKATDYILNRKYQSE